VDRRILFEESNIKTFFVDQTEPDTFDYISTKVDSNFDLIIDDGLHCLNANIATLIFACKNLKKGGWFVVEDIGWPTIPVWRVVSELLPEEYQSWLIDANGGRLFVVNRSGAE